MSLQKKIYIYTYLFPRCTVYIYIIYVYIYILRIIYLHIFSGKHFMNLVHSTMLHFINSLAQLWLIPVLTNKRETMGGKN